jgi:regulatory protein
VKKPRPPDDPDSSTTAYSLALRWLSARELSEQQVRDRLQHRGYTPTAVESAVRRLLQDRTIDDRRCAAAIARTEAKVRRRGPQRIMGRLIAMRIDRDIARDVVGDLFSDSDEEGLLEQALDRRLRGNDAKLTDPRERQKLFAYLVRQGFSATAASSLIRKRSREK